MEKKTKIFLFRLAFGVALGFLFAAISAIFINQVYLEQKIEKMATQSEIMSGKISSPKSSSKKEGTLVTETVPEIVPMTKEIINQAMTTTDLFLFATKENEEIVLTTTEAITTETMEPQTRSTERPKAKKCKTKKCLPPKCRCASPDIPGDLPRNSTPQIIVMAMNDPINEKSVPVFNSLLDGIKSANNCPIKATFFVSNTNTEYSLVEKLYKKGHEIADNSYSYKTPSSWWNKATYEQLEEEVLRQKRILQVAGIQISGWQSPFLEYNEAIYKLLVDNEISYDSSLVTLPGTRWWPFSLDFTPANQSCYMNNCPQFSYPGLWMMPISPWLSEGNGDMCTTFDQCLKKTNSAQDVYKTIMENFEKHYNDNKQPFPIFSQSSWFGQPNEEYRIEGLLKFINEARKLQDVVFITISQLIEWTKNPIPLHKNPWQC